MRSYETARNLFGFFEFCAWAVIVVGVIFAFMGGGAVSSSGFGGSPSGMQIFFAALPGGVVALAGFFGLALVQMGRTSVDCAEYAQQALGVSRQQLDISKQMLAQGTTMAASYAAMQPSKASPKPIAPELATAAAGATYADQSKTTSATSAAPAEQLSVPPNGDADLTAITKDDQPLLAPARHEITYRDGQFTVGDEAFANKSDATNRQAKLKAVPDKNSFGS